MCNEEHALCVSLLRFAGQGDTSARPSQATRRRELMRPAAAANCAAGVQGAACTSQCVAARCGARRRIDLVAPAAAPLLGFRTGVLVHAAPERPSAAASRSNGNASQPNGLRAVGSSSADTQGAAVAAAAAAIRNGTGSANTASNSTAGSVASPTASAAEMTQQHASTTSSSPSASTNTCRMCAQMFCLPFLRHSHLSGIVCVQALRATGSC